MFGEGDAGEFVVAVWAGLIGVVVAHWGLYTGVAGSCFAEAVEARHRAWAGGWKIQVRRPPKTARSGHPAGLFEGWFTFLGGYLYLMSLPVRTLSFCWVV